MKKNKINIDKHQNKHFPPRLIELKAWKGLWESEWSTKKTTKL